ncbi:23S rRNA (guanosine(2251)-2'-O)-methyltransferase RlmB [Desulfoluna spongiiphila]|uniref:23S rRNA (Guanosine2251-2'-O)-methyltransferase n=1 Tax=Desulfoluna spongiiphila TaxID=419481 RepID=A0A1G5AHS7_9BACT|nr:23S rRNA (guanosine(2251)-2'-O)-methyltransferase RlmB [Desulfoluna spongiiphila]SCX77423.1 23S rRNA (guanosine2251-2'-O)-methyltransferase [Desulfoluna spongiiphila]
MRQQKQGKRPKPSADLLYGINPVMEALKAGRRQIRQLILASGRRDRRVDELESLAQSKGVPVKRVDAEALEGLCGTGHHQGAALDAGALPGIAPEDLIQVAEKKGEEPFLVLLDSIEDPRNLGAIVRTAHCAGAHGVVVPKDRSAQLTSLVSKASAGALEHMPVAVVTNLAKAMEELKEKGLWFAGLDADGDSSLFGGDFTGPVGIVVGSEGKGLRPLVKKGCDFIVSIPLKGAVDSLNASVAASLVMYEVVRQRGGSEK